MSTIKESVSGNAQKIVLALIVVVYLGLASLYARSVPKWNAPDEPSHFNYIKTIVQTGTFPILMQGDYDFDYLEEVKAARFPDSLPIDNIRYESHQPPLYYALAAPILRLSSGLALDTQVLILRLISALFGAMTIAVTYSLARHLFPDDATLALAAAAFVAFLPMHVFLNAAVNNDSLANLLLSTLLLSLVSGLKRRAAEDQANTIRWTEPALARAKAEASSQPPHSSPEFDTLLTGQRVDPADAPPHPNALPFHSSVIAKATSFIDREALSWGVLLGLCLLTKVTAYTGLMLVAVVVVWQELARTRLQNAPGHPIDTLRDAFWRLAKVYGIALLLSGWWFLRNAVVYGNFDIFGLKRHDLVVAGQPLTGTFDLAAAKHFAILSFKSFWGVFGWMGIFMDERIYWILALVSSLAAIGFLLYSARVLFHPFEISLYQKTSLSLLFLALALVFVGWFQYNLTYIQAQGRYLFPAIASVAIFFSLGVREIVSRRHRALLFALFSLSLVALDVVSLYRFIIPQLR